MIDRLIQTMAERTAEVFRQYPDDTAMKRRQVESALLRFQQWLDALPAGYGEPSGTDSLPGTAETSPPPPDLIDPDAVISGYRCALCGEPETTARPITTWSFSLADGHWHIQACPPCGYNRIGVYLRDSLNLQPEAFERWKVSAYKFIRENGRKVRAG
jgi:hypothetical protein